METGRSGGLVTRLSLVAIVLHVGTAPLLSQGAGAVRGQVVAAVDGSALADVAVALRSAAGGRIADQRTETSGWFTFPDVAPGEYVLTAATEAFATGEVRFVLAPREVRTLAMALDVAGVAERVEVTGPVFALPGTHSPSSTAVTHERLDTTAVFQRATLADAIVTLAPGMIRGHDDFVHIRGHEVALNPLINGVSFWENTHAVFSPGLSPDVIEAANVMTGGFPAEYGNRFGGVVDIVTRSGLRLRHTGAATVSAGGAGRRQIGGEFGGRRGRFGYFVVGSLFESARFLSPPEPEAIHDHARGGHAFVQLDGTLGRAGSIRAVLMGDGTTFEIPRTRRDVELRPLALPRQETRQQTAIVSWMGAVQDTSVSASVYQRWSRAALTPASGPLTASARLERSLVTMGVKGDVIRFAGRHAVKAGVDGVLLRPRERLAYGYAGYFELSHLLGLPHMHVEQQSIAFAGERIGGQLSGYLQDSLLIGSRLTADIGLRVDRYDLQVAGTHLSPRVNLAVKVGGTVLHGSYNHFFVPPPIEGVLSSSAGLTRSIEEIGVALPPLDGTIEDQFEVGVASLLGPIHFAAAAYYRHTDNPIHTTVWPDSRIYSYASFDRASAYGLEAKAELKTGSRGLTGYANYALGRVYFHNPVTGGFFTEAAHLTDTNRFLAPMDQRHTLTGGLMYRHAATGVWGSGAVEYGSGTPMGHGGGGHVHAAGTPAHLDVPATGGAPRVPAHITGALSVGVDLLRGVNRRRRLALQFDLENLANDLYLMAQEGEFSPAQFSIPRLASVTAKLRF